MNIQSRAAETRVLGQQEDRKPGDLLLLPPINVIEPSHNVEYGFIYLNFDNAGKDLHSEFYKEFSKDRICIYLGRKSPNSFSGGFVFLDGRIYYVDITVFSFCRKICDYL